MSSPVGPSIQYPESPGLSDTSAVCVCVCVRERDIAVVFEDIVVATIDGGYVCLTVIYLYRVLLGIRSLSTLLLSMLLP